MSDLEYDILAGPYSTGYGAALSTVLQTPIRVLNKRHVGHLYSTLVAGDAAGITDHSLGSSLWESEALPMIHRHFNQFEMLKAGDHCNADQLAALFQQNTFLHHVILLPIRAQNGRFAAELSSHISDHSEEQCAALLDALDVMTSRDLQISA